MQSCNTVPFVDTNGTVRGWKTAIPGRRPLATPAVVGGRVFLGGGFGSHEFYALDATTGQQLWAYRTKDDGPTAAIVADDLVAFNTESCELEVLTVEGRAVWKRWLGDPLMSMPAAANGRVFMAYPDSKGDRQHYLACFDLRTGEPHWRSPIAGEIITAPVLADDRAYLTTLDGTVHAFLQADGSPVWHEALSATSSPVVHNGQCYYSRRAEVMQMRHAGASVRQQTERLSKRGLTHADVSSDMAATAQLSDYLDHEKRTRSSAYELECVGSDAMVGFAHAKGDSKMHQARSNLGHGSVAGCWAYQGSKPFVRGGRLYSSMGDTLKSVEPETEAVLWERRLYPRTDGEEVLDSVLTPPALVNGKAFVGTTRGDVVCLTADTGEVLWTIHVGEPVVFQPAVANGRVYAATHRGNLYCLETDDPADDGWLMWGGGPEHNGARL